MHKDIRINMDKLKNNNPGAINVLNKLDKLVDLSNFIDLALKYNIIGSKIWIIYKYVFNMDINKMIDFIKNFEKNSNVKININNNNITIHEFFYYYDLRN